MRAPSRLAMLGLAVVALAGAEPRVFSIRPGGEARFELRVHKTGLMSGKTHVFRFERFEGLLKLDLADPSTASIRFSIEAGSIVCLDGWVSAEDRGRILAVARGAMLDVERHRELSFVSESFEAVGEDAYRVLGRLAIRGRASEIPVEVAVRRLGEALLVDGKAVVALDQYGLKPPSAALGLIGTKRDMDVSFALRAEPAKE